MNLNNQNDQSKEKEIDEQLAQLEALLRKRRLKKMIGIE